MSAGETHSTPDLRALAYRFAVQCGDAELGQRLDVLLAGLRALGPVDHHFTVTASRDGSSVDVRRDGVDIALYQRPSAAIDALVREVNQAAADASEEFLLLHAGALDAAGTGVLLPAASGAGKSTLVAALAAGGFGYLTDELVALDLPSGELLPYPKPITLKPRGLAVLTENLGESDPTFAPTPEWDDVAQLPVGPGTPRAIGARCRPGVIVVPRYVAGADTALSPLSDTEAFFALALNAVNLLHHGSAGAAALGELAARCTCVALVMSDLDAACTLVRGLLEGCPDEELVGVRAHVG